ncbi:hypothetical protein SPRG_12518 [Saprolegnia parasitica CBS 223.65]|uniref:Uncharacterized protein n=1 Tax=Saprolegnia parasitica (strain CBS 223.65) TaxID=695850 RepID=A0A067BX94_SAPPC|nr:hypothetical protein SPRG_12518 [Saprolegnia parasitica CBS 223.65]KDO21475.1 hypothetical protein SPRG_12518 [Saprolegnia parasitica CBS 223.65]|eukprot:XP_012207819.1 hypothetical protein SPRG_12518 [Saprolegnia parasitica CBS 223.65]
MICMPLRQDVYVSGVGPVCTYLPCCRRASMAELCIPTKEGFNGILGGFPELPLR